MPKDNNTEICCSFCGRTQDEVARLIEGPGVFICDNCISFCSSLLLDDENAAKSAKKKEKAKDFVLPTPQEIKFQLDQYVMKYALILYLMKKQKWLSRMLSFHSFPSQLIY